VATVDWCGVFTKPAEPPRFTVDAHSYGGAVAPRSTWRLCPEPSRDFLAEAALRRW